MAGKAPGRRSQLGVSLPPPDAFGGRYNIAIPSSYTIYDMDENEIGFIRQLSVNYNRRTEAVRHLNAWDAGRIVQIGWGPMEPISLSAQGFVLYTADLLDPQTTLGRLAKAAGIPVIEILNSQRIPFDIIMDAVHPSTGRGLRVKFGECVVSRYNYTVNIDNVHVTDTVDMVAVYVEEFTASGEPVPNPPA
jgi:hypothetical protein